MEMETRREGNGEEARPLQTIYKEASDRKERGEHPLSPVCVLSPRSVLSLPVLSSLSRFCPLPPFCPLSLPFMSSLSLVSVLSPRIVLSLSFLSSLSRFFPLSYVSVLSPRSVLSLSRFYPLPPFCPLSPVLCMSINLHLMSNTYRQPHHSTEHNTVHVIMKMNTMEHDMQDLIRVLSRTFLFPVHIYFVFLTSRLSVSELSGTPRAVAEICKNKLRYVKISCIVQFVK